VNLKATASGDVRLITYAPGHFHAALVQKEMHPSIAPRVHVYAPLGPDLLAHLGRIAGFNARRAAPTAWEMEVHAGPDALGRLLREKPGDAVVIAGRNRGKIDAILACAHAGLHVLADKPWVIEPEDLSKLARALDEAEQQGVVALDVMTERHEITTILQRELVNDPAVFGAIEPGTAEAPGVFMESTHYLLKQVAGTPLRRPAWFFDVAQQGEGLADVGTHLVDLVPWMLVPGQPIAESEVRVLAARRWPTRISRDDFRQVTGEEGFPGSLSGQLTDEGLPYFCNTAVDYALRAVHVRLNVLWHLAVGSDSHHAVFRGTRARVEVRQGAEEGFRPELYVVAAEAGVSAALEARVAALQAHYPGVVVVPRGNEFRLHIPDSYRVGHEAHFGEVTRLFLGYLRNPGSLPPWEKANMLAKYRVTTEGVRLAREARG
jgi:predicted dehydrogenase